MRADVRTPLWLELILATSLVALAYRLERAIQPVQRPQKPATPQHEHSGIDSEGAIGKRPSQERHSLQVERAREVGRGRTAATPTEIPAEGWKDVLWRVYRQIQSDRLLAVAAGAVFYMLLALFPAITALVSLYGLFADPARINDYLSLLAGVMPEGAIAIVRKQVAQLAATSSNALSLGFIFGLALALWSANAGMKAIIDALNVVYDEQEKRSFIKLTLVAYAFTIGGLAFVLLALATVVVLPLVFALLGVQSAAAQAIALLRWPVILVVVLLWLAVLYRYGPSRARPRWQWRSVGSAFAAVTWLAVSGLFSWYLSNFANYDATYGSLGAAIGLMMWLWLSVIVILVGGELNAEMEHQTAHDTTILPEKPLGERGAVMADTVGVARHYRQTKVDEALAILMCKGMKR